MDHHSSDATNYRNTKSSKIVVRQIPKETEWTQVENFLKQFGEIVSCDKVGHPENPTAIVGFRSSEDALTAVEKLNGHEYKGSTLKATMAVDKVMRHNGSGRRMGGGGRQSYDDGPNMYGGQHGGRQVVAEMPLRMVVNAKFVGAIIGQGGSNIRQITKDSKARCVVDVSRGLRDSSGNIEKIINIYGIPENASKACLKILEIIQREFSSDQSNLGKTPECELKLRAHNNLVGRLIGKGGGTIKKIMDETGCTIFVSNIGELSAFNMERTITIRGTSLEKISQAEHRISNKLRQCFENDVTNAPHTMYGGLQSLMSGMQPFNTSTTIDPYSVAPPFAQSMGGGSPYSGAPTPIAHQGMGQQPPSAFILSQQLPQGAGSVVPPMMSANMGGHVSNVPISVGGITEVVHVWVPNNMVGALIGTRGSHIRNVIRLTGAHVRIETGALNSVDADQNVDQMQNNAPDENLANGGGDQTSAAAELHYQQQQQNQRGRSASRSDLHPMGAGGHTERRVTITGTDQQQYKAQFWIFQRICEQGYHFFDEVRLCTEIQVPSKMVGRIIGKNGQNVRELQRLTGAVLKIPEDIVHDSPEDTIVRIIGNFNASQAVQARIRQLMQLMQNRPTNVQ